MAKKGEFESLVGQVFGRLTVIEHSHTNKDGMTYWKCQCECGDFNVVSRSNLRGGNVQSCGCVRRELSQARNRTHGGRNTKLYGVWHNMRDRCLNPNCHAWDDYGGRGITICAEWDDFAVFRDWALSAGYQEGVSLDRIDNDGDYEPCNCQWVTMKAQSNNRRSSHFVEYMGERKTITQWADIFGVNKVTLRWRLEQHNDDLGKALEKPTRHGGKGTRLYRIWMGVRYRCLNLDAPNWKDYGGRGITVCDEWKDFVVFREWALGAGYQEDLTLERIDNDGPYSPDNCRWATPAEQGTNKRNNRHLTYQGRTQTLMQWVRELGISKTTLMHRLEKYGDDMDAVMSEPIKEKRDKYLVSYKGVSRTVGEWAKLLGVKTKNLRFRLDKYNDNLEAAVKHPFTEDGQTRKVDLQCIT